MIVECFGCDRLVQVCARKGRKYVYLYTRCPSCGMSPETRYRENAKGELVPA